MGSEAIGEFGDGFTRGGRQRERSEPQTFLTLDVGHTRCGDRFS